MKLIGDKPGKRRGLYDPYLIRRLNTPDNTPDSESDKTVPTEKKVVPVSSDIDGSRYIQIPGTNSLIAKEESFKGMKWDETHYTLADNGLYMPTPELFMKHFLNVRDAFQNNTKLYDGNNNIIPKEEVEDLWNYLSSGYMGGCWTWLDAKFVEGGGALGLDILTDHEVFVKGSSKILTPKISKHLEQCVQEGCYVDLSFNSQGLPSKKASSQDYKQGENIYFLNPIKDEVAGFVSHSFGASLLCGRNPGGSYSRLGVFGCAEGARAKNLRK